MKNQIREGWVRTSIAPLGMAACLLVSLSAWPARGDALPGEGGPGTVVSAPLKGNSMMAASPMNDYTTGAVMYVLLIGFLVAILLIGGMLVLNLGLMSKREQDRIGGRTPSDVGILKHALWPQMPDESPVLPAMDDDEHGSVAERRQARSESGTEVPGEWRDLDRDRDADRDTDRDHAA